MTKDLFLDFKREIRHSLNRFLSILCIVAIGVAFFAGLKSSAPDMKGTMDNYYDQYNIMDLQVLSTLGLTADDIEAMRQVDGVENVQAGYFTDALATVDGSELVFRLHSMPESYIKDGTDCINEVKVVEGRLPQAENEIVIEDCLNVDYNLNVGDQLKFSSGTDTAITDGALKNDTFTVVGKITTPYYLTYDKGNSQISGRAISLYAYLPEDSFAYDVYTEAYVQVSGAKELNAFDSAYKERVKQIANELSNIGADRSTIRGNELRTQAQQALDESQKKYDEEAAAFDSQITDAEQQLQDAYTELINGEAELKSGKEKLSLTVDMTEEQIDQATQQLSATKKVLDSAQSQVDAGQKQYNIAKKQYDAAIKQNQQYISMLDSLNSQLNQVNAAMDKAEQSLEDKKNDPYATDEEIQMYEELLTQYRKLSSQIKSQYSSIQKMQSDVKSTISTINDAMDSAQSQLSSAKKQLATAQQQYNDSLAQLNQAKSQLTDEQYAALQKFAAAREELDTGWASYNTNKAELDTKKAEGQQKLDDAKEQLVAAKYEIDRIENAEWYVMDRTTNYGFSNYQSTVDRMEAISQIIPVFFILVAVLVCMTTMTRMVNEQRGTIGTYKALGYGDNAIASKYVLYVTAASVIGGVVGAILGVNLFPRAVYNAWSAMYAQPELQQTVHFGVIGISFLVTIVAMAITAYYTCHVELTSVPAQLMRPKSPKLGKAILLERMPFIWKRFNFSQKVTARNIFRYKKRLFMTIIGIMGCTALLLAGLGMNDTIGRVVSNQYEKIFRYDMSVTMENGSDMSSLDNTLNTDAVESYGKIGATTATLSVKDKSDSETATVYVTDTPENLSDYILLQNRKSQEPISLDDSGIVLTEKLASQLGVSVGDNVEVMTGDNLKKSIPVTGITENYVFHYAYMSQAAYQEYFWYPVEQDTALIKLSDSCTDEQETQLQDTLENTSGVSSVVAFADFITSFQDQVAALNSIVLLIIICAALLAFVVLYNLTNINVSERIREIATIKVLGFKDHEVAMYVYRENFVLTLMGGVLGLGLGVGLHHIIMQSIEQNNLMFGYSISPWSYLVAMLLTCVFSIIVMLYMYHKLVRIPMVESLKSVE